MIRLVISFFCRDSSVKQVIKVKKQHMLSDDEGLMQKALASTGPVAIAFYQLPKMRLYGGGVFDLKGCKAPDYVNHVVVVVGYGTTDKGQDYWIIKNSMGAKWGEDGFFRVPRGSKYCNIGHEVSIIEL